MGAATVGAARGSEACREEIMGKENTIRAVMKTKEGWSSETEVPDPPPAEIKTTVSSVGPEYHGGMVSRVLECTGTFRLSGWSGKSPRYEQV